MFIWSRLVAIAIWVSIFIFFSIYASASLPSKYVYRVFEHSRKGTIFTGTAFKMLYNGRHFLVTAAHVCDGLESEDKTVHALVEIGRDRYTSRILKVDKNADLCIMSAPLIIHNGQGLKLAKSSPHRNDIVNLIGFPHGEFKIHVYARYTYDDTGAVETPGYQYATKTLNVINFTGIPGQSGGPALNIDGEVIGVTATASAVETLIVPRNDLAKFLRNSISKPNSSLIK